MPVASAATRDVIESCVNELAALAARDGESNTKTARLVGGWQLRYSDDASIRKLVGSDQGQTYYVRGEATRPGGAMDASAASSVDRAARGVWEWAARETGVDLEMAVK